MNEESLFQEALPRALVYAGYLKQIKDENFIKQLFSEDLRKRFGKDPEKYIKYYEENLEYLYSAGAGGFAVDEDVKGLGLSNRQVELLDRCVTLLEKGEQRDLALRILKRYTREGFADAKQWRLWLEKNRNHLFFTDVGGYKFLVAEAPLSKPASEAAATAGP
jgi:hypothetical protein